MFEEPSRDYIAEFVSSLPASYQAKYDEVTMACHAAVAAARGDEPVSVGLLRRTAGAPDGLCVVARDQPGLLSTISAALVLRGMDVVDAEAYTRKLKDGSFEAVDLFWLRRLVGSPNEPITQAEAEGLAATLSETLKGTRRLPSIPPVSPDEGQPLHPSDTRVRFIEDKTGGLATLEVETGDRSGLLSTLTRALFEHRVQITSSQVTTRNGRVFDRFTIVEIDGSPINDVRRLELQVAVLGAIEPARRKPALDAAP